MFDVNNIEDLEEVSKTLINMCQEDIALLNIKRCHPKSCIMHYFPKISTCARSFLIIKDQSFDDDLTCKLSEIIKANNLVNKFLSLGIRPNQMQKIFDALFFASTVIMTLEKKEQDSASGHAYEGISDTLKRKGGHIRKHLCRKRVNQGARTVLGGNASLKIDQIGIPKGKMLTKPMVINNLNYDRRKTDLRQKGKLYSKRRTKNLFEVSQTRIDIGDILHMHLMKGDWVVMNRQPTLHRPSMMEFRVLPQDVKIFKISLAVTKP